MKHFFLLSAILVSSIFYCVATSDPQPVEAGKVAWGRDLDAALTASGKSGKPIFALFQEIPGCAGCKQFGKDVMSHPLVVAAVETEFVPLLIHNNKPGKDAEVRERFSEPAWNFQVVRFLDSKGMDLIPRKDQVWDTGGVAARMVATLKSAGRPVPGYLELLLDEYTVPLKQAAFAMSCFWTGEMKLGQLKGVVSTEAGFLGGREVVLLKYDPVALPLNNLIAAAEALDCATAVYVLAVDAASIRTGRLELGTLENFTKAPASDQKRQLMGTWASKLDLTASQATKVNAWIRQDPAKAQTFLTARQKAALNQ